MVYPLAWDAKFQECGRRRSGGFSVDAGKRADGPPFTHHQALSALLFLYKQVLGMELPWMQEIGRPIPAKRIPVALTTEEVRTVLGLMEGVTGVLAKPDSAIAWLGL
jgi:hypothetical protein